MLLILDGNANGERNKILILLLCILILLCGCQQNNGNKNVRESIGENIVTDESTTTFIEAVNVEKNEWEKVPVFILIIKIGLYILFTVL